MKTLIAAASLALATSVTAQTADDPNLWLEDVTGARALEWVKAQNDRYLPELEAVPGFRDSEKRALSILEDPRRIALPGGVGPSAVTATQVFNFWRDKDHVRGLWRVSPRAAFDAGKPQWRTLIDMDALEAEGRRNLQFSGATCLAPDYRRCLVALSVGGRDSVEVREFDTADARFVPESEGGFLSPDAKQGVSWVDRDHLLIASAAGPATTSGYAREARLWQRGTPLASARLLLSIPEKEMSVGSATYGSGEGRRTILREAISFWTGRTHHLLPDGGLMLSPLPEDADFQGIADIGDGPRAFALLRTAFNGIPAGSVVSYAVPAAGPMGRVEAVFTPAETQAVAGIDMTGKALYVSLLDNVTGRLVRIVRGGGGREPAASGWTQTDIAVPANASLGLVATDDADALYFTSVGFTEPMRLMLAHDGAKPATLSTAPAFLDPKKYAVTQHFATSKDGTRVPYFVIRPKAAKGPLKTYYWSYGGFEIPLTPAYLSPEALMWVEEGNQYVVANIRGGGEFGPRWHQAAMREKRQNSYDDLHAVAEDMKTTGLASKIAVYGRSNGGLMSSVAFTQRPDLYDAAIVGVPLADMKRYHRLLAGASWMGEYGDPDTPDWDFIRKYSPYQNLKADAQYPRVFFYTSTKDDRVHPGHARKMAARMQEQGHPIYYYENVNGGHAGVADLKEGAYRNALMLAYLNKELGVK